MKASELLIKCLENEGVEYVFGIPGEEILDIMDSLSRSSIKFVLTRHEQGAAFMANVYGRLTGKAGVCLSTIGPGATNLITGVANASLDYSPLVAISGQTSLDRIYRETHQYINVVEMFRPITKWTTRVEYPETLPVSVRKAFDLAQTERPGATHIEIPMDVSAAEVQGIPQEVTTTEYAIPSPPSIQRAATMIEQASYPVIIAGNGVIRRGAVRELTELAQKLQIPVTQTFMGIGSIDYLNPLTVLSSDLQARDWAMCGLDQTDVVITVGYDQIDCAPMFWNADKNKKIIHINVLSSVVDEHYLPEVELVGEIGLTLNALTEACATRRSLPIDGSIHELVLGELEKYRGDEGFPLKPQKVIADLRSVLEEDDIIITDVGAHKLWIARMYPVNKPNAVIISNGFASMGFAIPGAIATKLVYPRSNVVAVCGDGGFLMNSQELETAKRLGLSFVTVVWADSSYGLIEWKQKNKFGSSFGVSFSNPDLIKYADSLGLPGYRVNHPREFLPILQTALNQRLPSLIEVAIDYRENAKLAEKMKRVHV
ncbi:acetolactate synthase large subunit [Chloroflexota bacterium]